MCCRLRRHWSGSQKGDGETVRRPVDGRTEAARGRCCRAYPTYEHHFDWGEKSSCSVPKRGRQVHSSNRNLRGCKRALWGTAEEGEKVNIIVGAKSSQVGLGRGVKLCPLYTEIHAIIEERRVSFIVGARAPKLGWEGSESLCFVAYTYRNLGALKNQHM